MWSEVGILFYLCSWHANLEVLDMTLDLPPHAPNTNFRVYYEELDSVEGFCRHLDKLTSITHLRIRKSGDVYLTQKKSRALVSHLAKAVIRWKDLVCRALFLYFLSHRMYAGSH